MHLPTGDLTTTSATLGNKVLTLCLFKDVYNNKYEGGLIGISYSQHDNRYILYCLYPPSIATPSDHTNSVIVLKIQATTPIAGGAK
jgi:hypothetical protein